jgi:hypothetical protein
MRCVIALGMTNVRNWSRRKNLSSIAVSIRQSSALSAKKMCPFALCNVMYVTYTPFRPELRSQLADRHRTEGPPKHGCSMARTAVGLFEGQSSAEDVARELREIGLASDEVRVLLSRLICLLTEF